jgi:8-oxo-dGTP diphosphatase
VSSKPWKLSVKILVFNENNLCLLLKRSPASKGNPCKWEPAGGKIDPGESFDEAVLREVIEETGLKVQIMHVAGTAESELPRIRVIHLILEGRVESGKVRLSEEHTEFTWVKRPELATMDLADWFKPFASEYSKKTLHMEKSSVY